MFRSFMLFSSLNKRSPVQAGREAAITAITEMKETYRTKPAREMDYILLARDGVNAPSQVGLLMYARIVEMYSRENGDQFCNTTIKTRFHYIKAKTLKPLVLIS